MIKTKDDYIGRVVRTQVFDKQLVKVIIDGFIDWIENEMLQGNDIRLKFGKFEVLENNYPHSDILGPVGKQAHIHKYRPRFQFRQTFKELMDANEERIAKGKSTE